MEKLWSQNVTITTRLADTTTRPLLLKEVKEGKLKPGKIITSEFPLADIMEAYARSSTEGAHEGCVEDHRMIRTFVP